MAVADTITPGEIDEETRRKLEEIDYTGRKLGPRLGAFIGVVAFTWSLFQLWIASPLPYDLQVFLLQSMPKRGIHLAFALFLAFLMFPAARRLSGKGLAWHDVALALLGGGAALYLWLGYGGLVDRSGVLWKPGGFPVEFLIGAAGMVLLLEATRRAIGLPLVIVASVFLVYSVFGQSMPDLVSHKGVSLERLVGYHWLTGEAIFGIPISVSVDFVFLFVLFGALLDKAGAGTYFLDLAYAMVGKYRGGPAKAAILSSGLTGMISGSSIANVVTTGTFTIPVMKKMGLPAVKAGAIEVAASTNGQIMPPIMGAAAFVMAELIGVSYFEVVRAAFIPAVVSYLALLYISHLEAMKLDMKPMPAELIPNLWNTFVSGIHFLLPIAILIYLLMVEHWSAESSVFYSILSLMAIIAVQHAVAARRGGAGAWAGVRLAAVEIYAGMVAGARNMIGIGIAVACAGIIVGSVSSTGLNNAMVGLVEAISGGNVYILLILTAVLCLILGMGLPTTANYLVVASLLAPVLVELGGAAGLVLPLIAVHLFVFYFGILADDTPPVCLAAFAAAAISRADPIKTGIQGFTYDIRTAILPFIFLFNTELLLIGVDSWAHGITIFVVALLAMFTFSSAVQGWLLVRTRAWEVVALLVISFALFRPDFFLNQVYPEFRTADLTAFVDGRLEAEAGRKVRVHVTRSTDYGDRFKLFVLTMPDAPKNPGDPLGLTLAARNGGFEVVNTAFQGQAEAAGVTFGDTVTGLDVEQIGRPDKEWVYPIAFAGLGLVLLAQWRRRAIQAAARA